MGLLLNDAVMEVFTGVSFSRPRPLRWLPVDWTNILLAAAPGTGSNAEEVESERKHVLLSCHFPTFEQSYYVERPLAELAERLALTIPAMWAKMN